MILVTGGTGLVGSHLIFDLLTKGQKVKVLIRESSNKDKILQIFKLYSSEAQQLFDNIVWSEGDITDITALDEAFADVTYVYHAAAIVSFNQFDKKKVFEVNVDGTANIVNLCLEKKIEKLCHVSSIAALGANEDGSPVAEESSWKPSKKLSAYSVSKFKAEMEVWRGITEGLNAIIVNPSVILGPGDWKNNAASAFIRIDKGLPFYTKGTNGFVDVRDVTKAMVMLMESDISSERFILSAENLSYQELFNMISRSLHVKQPKWELTPLLGGMIRRFEFVRSLLVFSTPRITKSTMHTAFEKLQYSAEKISTRFNFTFTPAKQTVDELCTFYLEAKKAKQLG